MEALNEDIELYPYVLEWSNGTGYGDGYGSGLACGGNVQNGYGIAFR